MPGGAFPSLRKDNSPRSASVPRRILLVGEASNARRALAISLRVAGHEAFEAATAQEAMAAVESHDFALAVVEAELRDMTGADLVRALERRTSEMRLVLLVDPAFPSRARIDASLRRTEVVEPPLHVDAVLTRIA